MKKLDFVKEDAQSNIFDQYLTNEFQNKLVKRETESIETSHITECPRRLMYAADGEKGEYRETRLKAHTREFTRKMFVNRLGKNGLMKVVGEFIEVSDCNYNLIGRIDIALKHKDVLYLVQLYSLNNSSFEHILKEGPARKHVVEVVMNQWLAEGGEPIIIYENWCTGAHKVYHVKPYRPIIDAAKNKSRKLIDGKLTGIMPDRAYDSVEASECQSCEYNSLCW